MILIIRVISAVNDEIIFNVFLQISLVSVVNEETTFNVALQISAVSLVDNEISFNVVLQITLTNVFYFQYHQNEISDYAHYIILLPIY